MQLPSAQSVIDLTGTKLTSSVIDMIIADAALMADRCLSQLDGDTQESALRWLSAHLVASTSGSMTVASRKLGDASVSYASATMGDGIRGTMYGQQAVSLVPCLGSLGKSRAKITVI